MTLPLLQRYRRLCDAARWAYTTVLDTPRSAVAPGSPQFIWDHATEFANTYTEIPQWADVWEEPGPALTVLSLLSAHWPDIATGTMTGADLFRLPEAKGLWRRWMSEWPLGQYGNLVAATVNEMVREGDQLLELGAGVQHTTRQVNQALPPCCALTATDLIYDDGHGYLDIQEPFGISECMNIIYATNAVHCSRDVPRTLRYIHQALRPGGALVMGEGGPEPLPGETWALDATCGLMDGWWDRDGFRPAQWWRDALAGAGFMDVVRRRLGDGDLDLGGCWVARRPAS